MLFTLPFIKMETTFIHCKDLGNHCERWCIENATPLLYIGGKTGGIVSYVSEIMLWLSSTSALLEAFPWTFMPSISRLCCLSTSKVSKDHSSQLLHQNQQIENVWSMDTNSLSFYHNSKMPGCLQHIHKNRQSTSPVLFWNSSQQLSLINICFWSTKISSTNTVIHYSSAWNVSVIHPNTVYQAWYIKTTELKGLLGFFKLIFLGGPGGKISWEFS